VEFFPEAFAACPVNRRLNPPSRLPPFVTKEINPWQMIICYRNFDENGAV
jgi:hypothetical protein